eukprot:12259742-Alexandrium_andersonii.AAC.1
MLQQIHLHRVHHGAPLTAELRKASADVCPPVRAREEVEGAQGRQRGGRRRWRRRRGQQRG